jgi:tetratricopeptide (TPR) repeat protein
VLLTGEPGIGKSRMLREAMGWARQHGWRALWSGCQRSSGQEPYAPLVEALERHLHALPPDRLRTNLAGCAWLARLVPEVGELLEETGQHLGVPAALSSGEEQRLLFAAIERYLSNSAGRAGTLLVLDDLQWAGADAIPLLARLLRSTRLRRLRVLGAYRSTEVAPGHSLSTLIADLAREEVVSRLELAPLHPQDAGTLARAVLEAEGISQAMLGAGAAGATDEAGAAGDAGDAGDADNTPAARVVERIVERAGGVPFFIVSCARWVQVAQGTLAEQGVQVPGEAHAPDTPDTWAASTSDAQAWAADPLRTDLLQWEEVPWTVALSIRERVAILPAPTQDLLGVAAVIGQHASPAVLAAGADLPELETLTGLEIACQAGLLVEDPEDGRPERYRFAHDLIRDVVEASLSAGRQTLLHRRVAVALEQRLQHSLDAGHAHDRLLAQVAYHYSRGEVPELAAHYLRQAGDHARHVYAHQEAAQYYQELVAVHERLGPSREAARARRDLAVELARVGRFSEAVAPLEQAEQICRATGDVETLALVTMASGHLHAALGASEEGLARVQPLVEALAGGADATAGDAQGTADVVRTGSAVPAAASAVVTAQLQGALSGLCFMAGHYRDALDAAERAVGAAQTTGDSGLLARERLQLGVALFTVGRLTEATGQLEHAIADADAVGELETLAEALRMASWVYQTRGAFAQSQAVQVRGLAVAERLKDLTGLGHTLFLDALLAFYLGQWDRARAIGENSLAVLRTVGLSHLSAYPPLGLGWLCTIEGQHDLGEQYLAEAEALAQQRGPAQVLRFCTALRAECALLAGQPEVANALLTPWFTGEPMQERTRLELSVLRAWAAVELGGEADDTEAWVTEAVGGARACHMDLILPDALRVHALWAIRRRRWEEAKRALDEAVSLSQAMPYPYAEAKALYVLGQLWAAGDEPARARECFARAQAICDRLGERLYGAAIEQSVAASSAAGSATLQTSRTTGY